VDWTTTASITGASRPTSFPFKSGSAAVGRTDNRFAGPVLTPDSDDVVYGTLSTTGFQAVLEMLKNRTDKTLVYDPHLLAARLGSKLFYSSVTVASGQIPSHGESPVWFAVTGTSSGGRNEMAAENNWIILLTAGKIDQKKTTLDINRTIITEENNLKEQIYQINKTL